MVNEDDEPAALYAAFCAAHPLRRVAAGGRHWPLIEAGAGAPPLLLLPGGFGVAGTSFAYVRALSVGRRVIALHYPPDLDTMAALCDGLAALLDALGVGRAHVVGGSASGLVAQVLVRRHPARVASLILAQSGAPRPGRARLSRALGALVGALPAPLCYAALRLAIGAFLPGAAPAARFWRAHFAAVLAEQSRAALANRFRLAADFDATYRFGPGDLADWPGRVTIIESQGDGIVGAAERGALRALYPQARLVRLAGQHADSVARPAAQIAAIAAALE